MFSNYSLFRSFSCLPRLLFYNNGKNSVASMVPSGTNQPKQQQQQQKPDQVNDILYKTIQLEARSADRAILNSYEQFVLMVAKFLDITVSKTWEPFRSIRRRTLLRAAFVKKKYRVQYEFRTYFKSIELKHLTGSTADTFLEYIERNLPEGAALKVFKIKIERLPEHLKPDFVKKAD